MTTSFSGLGPAWAPTLETDRLILREHRMADFDEHLAMWRDPLVIRFLGGEPYPREQIWARYLRHVAMWQMMGFGSWAVEEKDTGRLIGQAGFHELMRVMKPSLEGTLEMGWVFASDVHGKGLASEAIGACVAWGTENFPDKRITCIIDPENAASLKVAARHGFREFDRTMYQGKPIIVLER